MIIEIIDWTLRLLGVMFLVVLACRSVGSLMNHRDDRVGRLVRDISRLLWPSSSLRVGRQPQSIHVRELLDGMAKIGRDAQARMRKHKLASLADLCGRDTAMMGGHISQGEADAR